MYICEHGTNVKCTCEYEYQQSDNFRTNKQSLKYLLKTLSLEEKEVVLSSGKKSNYYIDCKKVILSAKGHALIGNMFNFLISEDIHFVGGLGLGAYPIISAISTISYTTKDQFLNGIYFRKDIKAYGSQAKVEGLVAGEYGQKIVLVDDVCTTGTAILLAKKYAEEAGFKVAHTYVLVDRLEGGREALEKENVPFTALYTIDDLR